MSFLFICGIRFIRVICGSRTTVFFTADDTDYEPSVRHRLTLMLFLFIRVISGSRTTVLFTADDTDYEPSVRHRLTLMWFLFICGIRFISVICGSRPTVLFTTDAHRFRTFGSTLMLFLLIWRVREMEGKTDAGVDGSPKGKFAAFPASAPKGVAPVFVVGIAVVPGVDAVITRYKPSFIVREFYRYGEGVLMPANNSSPISPGGEPPRVTLSRASQL
jgi:hypothetical protein